MRVHTAQSADCLSNCCAENLLLKNGGDALAAAREADDLFNVSRILAMDMAESQKNDASFNVRPQSLLASTGCNDCC
jgi:hypothetical protein